MKLVWCVDVVVFRRSIHCSCYGVGLDLVLFRGDLESAHLRSLKM